MVNHLHAVVTCPFYTMLHQKGNPKLRLRCALVGQLLRPDAIANAATRLIVSFAKAGSLWALLGKI
jgi:hypothetical protein